MIKSAYKCSFITFNIQYSIITTTGVDCYAQYDTNSTSTKLFKHIKSTFLKEIHCLLLKMACLSLRMRDSYADLCIVI